MLFFSTVMTWTHPAADWAGERRTSFSVSPDEAAAGRRPSAPPSSKRNDIATIAMKTFRIRAFLALAPAKRERG
jgi:hypothetical protein